MVTQKLTVEVINHIRGEKLKCLLAKSLLPNIG